MRATREILRSCVATPTRSLEDDSGVVLPWLTRVFRLSVHSLAYTREGHCYSTENLLLSSSPRSCPCGHCFAVRLRRVHAYAQDDASGRRSLLLPNNSQISFWKESVRGNLLQKVPSRFILVYSNYFAFSSIATATATVIPTMGLLPAPMSPIISVYEEFIMSFQTHMFIKI